ncbi:RNB domain-containing ribonuclease [Rhodococcus opacus]|nr:RNB domain-containing ribonuclease [Rhodococcus opacus]MDV6247024.1 RNB domain-containing ribonuclease [Rhodococcus opacus]
MTSSTVTDVSTLLMIDSATARDRDDAISVTPLPGGRGWAVEVHIAGVADVVELGSVADEQAFLRAETRYLRSRTIPMLGETAEQAATLTAGSRRTSLRVTGTLTSDGQLVDVTVGRGEIPPGRCVAVDHAEVPGILSDPAHPLHPQLVAADAAAQVLLGARRDGGALAFYDLTRGWASSEDGAIVAIAADLTALDSRRFHKILKAEATGPLRAELASELARRVDADLMTAPDVAVLIDAADPTWLPIQLRVIDTLADTHPEMGPSVASVWRQAHPDQPPPELEIRRNGADHNPLFAARATHQGVRGPWATAAAKKPAKQAALWAAVRAQLTGIDNPDADPEWPTTAPSPEPTTPPPAPEDSRTTSSGLPHRTTTPAALNLDGAKKSKALSNPTAWLMSLARNNNQAPPVWEFHTDGPAHAPRFTATVRLAGHTATATATTKTAAKTASAAALIETPFRQH